MKPLISLLAALVVVLTLTGCGGDDEASPSTTTTETQPSTETPPTTTTEAEQPVVVRVTVVGGAPQGGITRATVHEGDSVVLLVSSDVADEVHLHGYDISRDVTAGGTARIPFRASVPGRFEVELERRGTQIADLTVEP